MTDIVDRLRKWHTPGETITGDVQLYLDAADEIERLRRTIGVMAIELSRVIGEAKSPDCNNT